VSFRKEKKFRVTFNEYYYFQSLLISKGMKPLFDVRTVNSIYFDTKILDMFNLSEEGVLPRKKIRIRWYNDLKQFSLETKISSIEGRFKKTEKLIEVHDINDVLSYISFDNDLGILSPSLLVTYERLYFLIGDMRITFDQNINYKYLRKHKNITYNDPERVIEIKAPIEMSDNYIETIIPFSTTRFSKYSRGLLMYKGSISEA